MIVRTQDKVMATKTDELQYIMFIFLEPEQKKYRTYNKVIFRRFVNKSIYNTSQKLIDHLKTYPKEFNIDTLDLRSNYFKEELTNFYIKNILSNVIIMYDLRIKDANWSYYDEIYKSISVFNHFISSKINFMF